MNLLRIAIKDVDEGIEVGEPTVGLRGSESFRAVVRAALEMRDAAVVEQALRGLPEAVAFWQDVPDSPQELLFCHEPLS